MLGPVGGDGGPWEPYRLVHANGMVVEPVVAYWSDWHAGEWSKVFIGRSDHAFSGGRGQSVREGGSWHAWCPQSHHVGARPRASRRRGPGSGQFGPRGAGST